jgi:hypothetical protein
MRDLKAKGNTLLGLDARTLCLEVMARIAIIRH